MIQFESNIYFRITIIHRKYGRHTATVKLPGLLRNNRQYPQVIIIIIVQTLLLPLLHGVQDLISGEEDDSFRCTIVAQSVVIIIPNKYTRTSPKYQVLANLLIFSS